jgi:hypothetical protein
MLNRKCNALLKPVFKAFLYDGDCAVTRTLLALICYPYREGGSVPTATQLTGAIANCKMNYLGCFLKNALLTAGFGELTAYAGKLLREAQQLAELENYSVQKQHCTST